MVYARLRRDAGRLRLTVAAAGHPLPVLVPAVGEPVFLGRPGMLLGIVAEPRLHSETVRLAAGDVVVFYTDGVSEGRRDGEFFGEERLVRALTALRGEDAATIAERIGEEVVDFQDGAPRDDIALVVLRVP